MTHCCRGQLPIFTDIAHELPAAPPNTQGVPAPGSTVQLTFVRDPPQWLRVYELRADSAVRLLNDLCPTRKGVAFCEYQDTGDDISAQAARIYVSPRQAPLSG